MNLIGTDKHTSEKQILLSFIVVDPGPFFSNSEIYSDMGLNVKENENSSTNLIINRYRARKILLNSDRISEDSNPNRKWTRSNATPMRRLLVMTQESQ